MKLKVYLSGEIHTNWRDEIKNHPSLSGLAVEFSSPVTNHQLSDDCGVAIMGEEVEKFWHDNKGAKLNSIRTKKFIEDSDVVIVRFGEKYKQWNAAFEAGYAAAMNKSLIIMHSEENQHALKEVDASANAVIQSPAQAALILKYIISEKLN